MKKIREPKILLSICIPTYNRSKLLQECLHSIVKQFNNKRVYHDVEIVISNNNSEDDTEKTVRSFREKYDNIRYFKNKINIGTKNTIKVATYARGEYIWFFSDDDWQKKNSIIKIIDLINKYKPNLILANLDLYSKDGKTLIDSNLLRTNRRDFFGKKKELFKFLERKFFLPIDWHMTSYSNTILKSDLFKKERKKAYEYFKKGCLFPHTTFFYYSPLDYKIIITGEALIKFRADNRSFGSKDKYKFLVDWYRTLRRHYDNIYSFNKKYISLKFTFLLFIKQLLRSVRLWFLLLFGIDISDFLIKYFYRKQ